MRTNEIEYFDALLECRWSTVSFLEARNPKLIEVLFHPDMEVSYPNGLIEFREISGEIEEAK